MPRKGNRIVAAPGVGAAAASITLDTLNAGLRAQVVKVKGKVLDLANKFSVVRESVKGEIGPRVMRIFNAIRADAATEKITFVEFARMFDPKMPTHAKDLDDGTVGYRNHKVYYTLDYMRRQLTQRPRGAQGVRDTATDALARSIATILQVVTEPEPVWKAVQAEFGFGERIMGRLRKRVEDTKPLFQVKVPKGAIKVGDVIHMESNKAAAAHDEAVAAGRRKVG